MDSNTDKYFIKKVVKESKFINFVYLPDSSKQVDVDCTKIVDSLSCTSMGFCWAVNGSGFWVYAEIKRQITR